MLRSLLRFRPRRGAGSDTPQLAAEFFISSEYHKEFKNADDKVSQQGIVRMYHRGCVCSYLERSTLSVVFNRLALMDATQAGGGQTAFPH